MLMAYGRVAILVPCGTAGQCLFTYFKGDFGLLQAAADQGFPPQQQHQLLNLGLMLMGFGHVAILAPLWNTAEAGPLLHQIVAFWGTVGAIGTFGGLSGLRSRPPLDPDV